MPYSYIHILSVLDNETLTDKHMKSAVYQTINVLKLPLGYSLRHRIKDVLHFVFANTYVCRYIC